MNRSALAPGAAVVLLSGLAAWVGAHLAEPAPAAPEESGRDAGTADRLDELDRRVGYLDRRLDQVEASLAELRGLLENAPPKAADGSAGGAAADGTGRPAGVGPPGPSPEAGEPVREKTDAELQAEREAKLQQGWRQAAQRFVPARLMAFADDRPAAAEKRRLDAVIEARQVAAELTLPEDQLDRLEEIYREQAERMARDVGPLVRDGLEKADVPAVLTQLDAVWTELDRRVRDVVGPEKFERYRDGQAPVRGQFREVLEGYRPKETR